MRCRWWLPTPWRLAGFVLALVAAAVVGPRLLLVPLPFQLDYNEGWNVYRATLVRSGEPLYDALPHLSVTNYPPLSFHLVAWLDRPLGDLLRTGRLLSLAGLGATAFATFLIVTHLTANRMAGLCAALLGAIWIGLYAAPYIAMNDPQLVAMGFTTIGLLAALRAGPAAWLVLSAMAFAIGLFMKHNLVDFPAAVALHLMLCRRWRDLALWAGTGLAAAGLLAAGTVALHGPHAIDHILIGRDTGAAKALGMAREFLVFFAGALVLTAIWVLRQPLAPARRLVVLALAASFALGTVLAAGAGMDRNTYFNAIIALAAATGLAWHDILARATRWRLRVAVLLVLPLLPGIASLPHRVVQAADILRESPERARAFHAGAALLAPRPGPVLCENMQLCVAAGHRPHDDPFFIDDRIRRGLVPPHEVAALLAGRHWGAIVLDRWWLERLHPGIARERFAAPVVDAILADYRVAFEARDFAILVPDR